MMMMMMMMICMINHNVNYLCMFLQIVVMFYCLSLRNVMTGVGRY